MTSTASQLEVLRAMLVENKVLAALLPEDDYRGLVTAVLDQLPLTSSAADAAAVLTALKDWEAAELVPHVVATETRKTLTARITASIAARCSSAPQGSNLPNVPHTPRDVSAAPPLRPLAHGSHATAPSAASIGKAPAAKVPPTAASRGKAPAKGHQSLSVPAGQRRITSYGLPMTVKVCVNKEIVREFNVTRFNEKVPVVVTKQIKCLYCPFIAECAQGLISHTRSHPPRVRQLAHRNMLTARIEQESVKLAVNALVDCVAEHFDPDEARAAIIKAVEGLISHVEALDLKSDLVLQRLREKRSRQLAREKAEEEHCELQLVRKGSQKRHRYSAKEKLELLEIYDRLKGVSKQFHCEALLVRRDRSSTLLTHLLSLRSFCAIRIALLATSLLRSRRKQVSLRAMSLSGRRT
jgi:hypothetical protein